MLSELVAPPPPGLLDLFARGGIVMVALLALSVLLYERCFSLLLRFRRCRRALLRHRPSGHLPDQLRQLQDRLGDHFRQRMVAIRPMVAAAPLLGLLGTVIGMIETFESLSERGAENTVQGLSEGISKALITTETGLAIAIPAAIILYFAQRQLNAAVRILVGWESESMEDPRA